MAPCSRRRALRLLSAAPLSGLAGCLGGPVGEVATYTSTNAIGLAFSVSVVHSFTDDHPGRVDIELTNTSEESVAMSVAHHIRGPFSAVEGDAVDGEATLLLFADPPAGDHRTPPGVPCRSDDNAIPSERSDGCWQPACEYDLLHAHASVTLAAGETLAWPYVVLDGGNEQCLPAGTYRFVETSVLAPVEGSPTGVTPAGGWTHRVVKRVELELAADGTLAATASLEWPEDEGAGGTPPPTPNTVGDEG